MTHFIRVLHDVVIGASVARIFNSGLGTEIDDWDYLMAISRAVLNGSAQS